MLWEGGGQLNIFIKYRNIYFLFVNNGCNRCFLFLFCVDFVAVLTRLRLFQVVHIGHPGSIVPDKRLSSLHGRTDAQINESINFMSSTKPPLKLKINHILTKLLGAWI